MRKNKMMRLASSLLVAVLITTSTISGTFAKYTTSDSASDTARVAKWGVSLQVVGDLYGESYLNAIVADNDASLTVQAKEYATSDENIVAPGTENTKGLSFGLTGEPEVDYQIDATIVSQNIFLVAGDYGLMVPVEAGKITAENWSNELFEKAGADFVKSTTSDGTGTYYTLEDTVDLSVNYYPVSYTLSGATGDVSSAGSITKDSLKDAASVIAQALNTTAVTGSPDATNTITTYNITDKQYNSNTDIASTLKLSNMDLTWEWTYEHGTDPAEIAMYDGADTVLGNLMAAKKASLEGTVVKLIAPNKYGELTENADYCLNSQFSIDITVTQVD